LPGEVTPFDLGFADRRELWRLPTYLAVIAVDGLSSLGQEGLRRLAAAAGRYGQLPP